MTQSISSRGDKARDCTFEFDVVTFSNEGGHWIEIRDPEDSSSTIWLSEQDIKHINDLLAGAKLVKFGEVPRPLDLD